MHRLFVGMDEEKQVKITLVRSTMMATQEDATCESEDAKLKRARIQEALR